MAKGKSNAGKSVGKKDKEEGSRSGSVSVEGGSGGAVTAAMEVKSPGAGAGDWGMDFDQPRVEWVAPEDQVVLSEEELNGYAEPVMLRNGNPNLPSNVQKFDFTRAAFVEEPPLQYQELHHHLERKGRTLHVESHRAKAQEQWFSEEIDRARQLAMKQADTDEEDLFEHREVAKNQFNYSSRAAQTFNNPMRSRGVATKPPELKQYSDTVNQWTIYDLYVAKFLDNMKDREILNASQKRKKHENDPTVSFVNDDPGKEEKTRGKKEEDVVHSEDMGKALKILERMVNQNAETEIYEDFKYWEDQSDAFREGEGSLLPLWRFSHDRVKKKHVTALSWNPTLPDLFAVGYGSYDFMRQGSGVVCCYSLKNTSSPEFMFTTESGVMCLDFHPQSARCALLAVGCYDGSVLVYDVRNKVNKPIYMSTIKTGKHTDPVWEVRWQEEDIAKELGFFSVSSDGHVANWTMSKNELKMETAMQLKLLTTEEDEAEEEAALSGLAGGCCFDFNKKSEHLFLVGTEEGKIHKCSKAYSGQYLQTYIGHHMQVYAVKWNPFSDTCFLSCSADWTVKLWDQACPSPIMSFDIGNAVGDVSWAPYSSTVFASVTNDGKVHVFDLNENKHEPLCEQKVVKRARLTHVEFNAQSPILLVGDDRGGVNSLKLSPNLRKAVPLAYREEKIARIIQSSEAPIAK